MIERTVTIGTRVGLHARPASLFVKKVSSLPVEVTIGRSGGEPVDARSIMSVLALDIAGGESVTLATPDDDAGDVLDDLGAFLARDLDEHAAS